MTRCAYIHRTAKGVSRARPQLGALTALLERENRIKEGAEKFLKLPITVGAGHASQGTALSLLYKDTMRMQVESELEMATNEIEILTKRIEQGEVSLSFVLCQFLLDISKKHRVANGEGMALVPRPSASSPDKPRHPPSASEQTAMTGIEVITR